MSRKVTGTARCGFCDWIVRFSGDDVIEVSTFLRRMLLAHVEEMH